tara:strand:- start:775 stop:1689 length:915 start_codon:yes stop_codon:yes gene_type:complete
MKIYINKLNESWIVDRLKKEWTSYNGHITTKRITNSNIIWIISPWTWKKISKKQLNEKKVLCSIYHIDDKKFDKEELEEFLERDRYVSEYHVISNKTIPQLKNLTDKKITYIPFWVNQNKWYKIYEKDELRSKYNFKEGQYLVGSFQRDSEGSNPDLPKLIKGPDQFLEVVKHLNKIKPNLCVVLTGKRRNYVINELKKEKIDFSYFEMVDISKLNELYNLLDLYIVASRLEGGPQAIVECGITKTPIISTDVGIAKEILSEESIFNMDNFRDAEPSIEFAYNKSKELTIPKGFEKFVKLFESI